MDHCPPTTSTRCRDNRAAAARSGSQGCSCVLSAGLAILLAAAACAGPATLRPTAVAMAVLVSLMAVGAFFGQPARSGCSSAWSTTWRCCCSSNTPGSSWRTSITCWPPAARHCGCPIPRHAHAVRLVLRAAGRHLVLHLPVDELHHRFLPGQSGPRTELPALCDLRLLLSAADGRADRAGQAPAAAVPASRRRSGWPNLTDGLSLFLVGLFKKLALANYLALYVDRVYDNPERSGAAALVLATFAFAWQIFFDFSGYTDMARGVAQDDGLQPDPELQQPLPGHRAGRFLVALAHQPLHLVPRLRLYPAGRQAAAAAQAPTAICSSPSWSRASGTARTGRSPSGACCMPWA